MGDVGHGRRVHPRPGTAKRSSTAILITPRAKLVRGVAASPSHHAKERPKSHKNSRTSQDARKHFRDMQDFESRSKTISCSSPTRNGKRDGFAAPLPRNGQEKLITPKWRSPHSGRSLSQLLAIFDTADRKRPSPKGGWRTAWPPVRRRHGTVSFNAKRRRAGQKGDKVVWSASKPAPRTLRHDPPEASDRRGGSTATRPSSRQMGKVASAAAATSRSTMPR